MYGSNFTFFCYSVNISNVANQNWNNGMCATKLEKLGYVCLWVYRFIILVCASQHGGLLSEPYCQLVLTGAGDPIDCLSEQRDSADSKQSVSQISVGWEDCTQGVMGDKWLWEDGGESPRGWQWLTGGCICELCVFAHVWRLIRGRVGIFPFKSPSRD